jgi:hypothetical protein
MRARERDWLFDMVKIGASDGRPHSEERSCRPLKRCLERGDRSLVHAQLYKRHFSADAAAAATCYRIMA